MMFKETEAKENAERFFKEAEEAIRGRYPDLNDSLSIAPDEVVAGPEGEIVIFELRWEPTPGDELDLKGAVILGEHTVRDFLEQTAYAMYETERAFGSERDAAQDLGH